MPEQFREKLIEITKNSNGKFTASRMMEKFFSKNFPEYIPFIMAHTEFYSENEINFTKRILLIIDNISDRILCNVCKKPINPMSRAEPGINFRKLCSSKCAGLSNKGLIHVRTKEHQLEINVKRESTMIEKHGYSYNSQRPEVKEILSAKKYETHCDIRYDFLTNKEYLIELYRTYPSTEIGELCNCDYSVVLDYLRKYDVEIGSDHSKISREQREIGDYIQSLGFDVQMNAKILGNKDIDIFIPSMNVGVEFNGFPWHLENFTDTKRDKSYHLAKTDYSNDLGIRLIHVFPHDLKNKKSIIFSIIKNSLGASSNKIYARKCEVKVIDKQFAKSFLNQNHLKGSVNFDVCVGLFFNSELVHVVTFGDSRFDKKYKYEIIRSSSLINTSVIGGFSKCLKFFVKHYCNYGDSIMTYADRSISEGISYIKSGFKFVRKTEPSYYYTERYNGEFLIHSRFKFQKYKLKKFINYSVDKSEWEIMKEAGYDRYWDCGNNVYEYIV